MISLQEVRNRVKSLTNHYPTTEAYNSELDELINTSQEEIWTAKPWVFAHRECELPVRPDITSTETIGVNRGGREVHFQDAIRQLGHLFFSETWEGQVMEINGRDYPILTVIDEEVLLLAEPYQGDNDNAISDWRIKHPYYRLPPDCLKLLQWTQTDKPVPGNTHTYAPMAPVLDQACYFPHSQTANQAERVFRIDDLHIPPGEKVSASWADTSAVSTSIPANRWYELAWSFKYAGRYGPLSQSVITKAVSGVATKLSLTVSALDMLGKDMAWPNRSELEIPYPKDYEGYKKVLWYNCNVNPTAQSSNSVRLGPPCWKPVLDFVPAGDQFEYKQLEILWGENDFLVEHEACFAFNANANLHRPGNGSNPTPNRWIPHNIQQVRPYPRIDASDVVYEFDFDSPTLFTAEEWKRIIIRYLARPNQMVLATDPISIPDDCVNCLVYKVLENTFNKINNSNMANYYAVKFGREVKSMERRHLASVEDVITRGSWNYSDVNSAAWNLRGRVTING